MVKMTKRYSLLKDLPDGKAGLVLVWSDEFRAYLMNPRPTHNVDTLVFVTGYPKETVENNPTWFELIKEEQPKEWEILTRKCRNWELPVSNTDFPEGWPIHSVKRLSDGEVFSVGDLVAKPMKGTITFFKHFSDGNINVIIEGLNKVDHYNGNGKELLKSLPQEQSKRIKVNGVEFYEVGDHSYMEIKSSSVIPQDKFPAIKAAIERVLNDEGDDIHDMVKKMEQMGWLAIKREEFYFQLREAEEKAFNAGRDRIGGFWNNQITNWQYKSFSDYKNHKP